MPALLIINYDATDPERLYAYRPHAIAALVGPGKGTPAAATDNTVDLGEGNGAGATTVVLEFPSVEAAQTAFDSEVVKESSRSARRVALVRGSDGDHR